MYNRNYTLIIGVYYLLFISFLLLIYSPHSYSYPIPSKSYFIDKNLADAKILENAFEHTATNHFHLLTHGRSGELLIEGEWKDASQIENWFAENNLLNNHIHLNIYGCEFGKGKEGKAAIAYLENALGISIAASDDITGIDGDWELEVGTSYSSLTFEDYTFNLQCACNEFLYINEIGTDPGVHKFLVNSDGTLDEIGSPWFSNNANDIGLTSPHGLGTDLNGYLYIGENFLDGFQIRKFTCDGEPFDESDFAITTNGQFNISSIDNSIFLNDRVGDRAFSEYDACTGTLINTLEVCDPAFANNSDWGFYIDQRTDIMYATRGYNNYTTPNDLYVFTQADFDNNPTSCIDPVPLSSVPAGIGQFVGVTTDMDRNIYIVAVRETNQVSIIKYDANYQFIGESAIDDATSGGGWAGSRGIAYSENANRLYLVSSFNNENCVSVFDTNLTYQFAAVGPVATSDLRGKAVAVNKECCPIPNNQTIDQLFCVTDMSNPVFLNDVFPCDGIVCEGIWMPADAASTAIYNDCNQSIIAGVPPGCYSFTKESDGTGNNPQCGAFVLEFNLEVLVPPAMTLSENQTICSGTTPTELSITTTATNIQWQMSTDSCMGAFVDIFGAIGTSYQPPALTDTTYFRVMISTSGTCTTETCSFASECIVVTIGDCDWGDLPDTGSSSSTENYQTTRTNNGPQHLITTGLSLGTIVDGELNGQPSNDALGDGADEDGITFLSSTNWAPGGIVRIPFSAINTTGNQAELEIWIDWNGDGDFSDPDEWVIDLSDDGAANFGQNGYLTINIPNNVVVEQNFGFRVRLSHEDDMTPYGTINSGEIEDYLLQIDCDYNICLAVQIQN